ncbi:uncharacterized protein DS421_7g212660 [Arachis hypogaea]|nr:uncharacterized protein DS421_7g212660 [Arachis hypogaea]
MDELRDDRHNHDSASDYDNEEIISIAEEDISGGVNICFKSLIGRVFAARSFSVSTMKNAFKAIWNRSKGFQVEMKGHNQFQFFFDKETDVVRIERGSPWLFKNYILHVQRWKAAENSGEGVITTIPIWVQFWGLPEQFKTLEVGSKLGRSLGEVEDIGFFQVRGKETRIIKAKVMINGEKRLKDNLKLAGPDQKTIEIGLKYERIGKFCTYCACLGHDSKQCQKRPNWRLG